MERIQITFALNLISVTICVLGDAVAFFPTEARAMNQFQYIHPFQQFEPVDRNVPSPAFVFAPEPMFPQGAMLLEEPSVPQERAASDDLVQPILHTGAVPPSVPEKPLEGLNFTEPPRHLDEGEIRTAKDGYSYPAHPAATYPPAPSYGYNQPSSTYSPPAPASHYTPPAAPAAHGYPAPPAHHAPVDKFSLLKPDLGFIKPVTSKVASKVSGLLSLVLSLFSGSGDLEMKGFKDIIINGILKPLLIAKGGIKSLISKLTIPVIALLLINLEVLVTVWWLWEECPDVKPVYEYSKPSYPAAPGYNSYR